MATKRLRKKVAPKPVLPEMDWVQKYQEIQPLYAGFCVKLHALLTDLMTTHNIAYHVIEHRSKTVESFKEKVHRDGKSYADPLREITDLAGVRIILYYQDDVERVIDFIDREFTVDHERSIDKRDVLAPDQFGYLSVHKIIRLSDARASLPEWQPMKPLAAELQIRTVLQHSWAAISHALQYNSDADVPRESRRRLNRLAGLLELADEEFNSLRVQQEALGRRIARQISAGNLDIRVNSISVRKFLSTSELPEKIVSGAVRGGFISLDDFPEALSQVVRACKLCKVRTVRQLEATLKPQTTRGLTAFFKQVFELMADESSSVGGTPAHFLAMVIIGTAPPDMEAEELGERIGWSAQYTEAVTGASIHLRCVANTDTA